MVEQVHQRMTAAEFFQLPETNLPLELLDGEVIEMPAPELDHQDVVGNIFVMFRQKAAIVGGKAYVAPVDVYFDDLNIPQPDVMWIAPESRCQPEGKKRLVGPPDLIVEVLSPGTTLSDRKTKFRLYERYGVREYWLADPRDQLMEVWQNQDGRFVLLDVYSVAEKFVSALLGEIDVAAIFSA